MVRVAVAVVGGRCAGDERANAVAVVIAGAVRFHARVDGGAGEPRG
jgi:hypothetical protein